MHPEHTLRQAEHAVQGDLPGETVVLDTSSGRMMVLNEAAAALWSRLADPCGATDLESSLVDRYGIDPEAARRDVAAFVEDMIDRDLIESAES